MKKITAILITLCLLCAAFAAVADIGTPVFEDMPSVIMEDENTTVDEAGFNGEWTLYVAFLGTEYITNEEIYEKFGYIFEPLVIADRKISKEVQNEFGEFTTVELPLTFESGQMWGVDGAGTEFVIEQLEDGNLVLSVFFPGEDGITQCLSLFLQHPTEV